MDTCRSTSRRFRRAALPRQTAEMKLAIPRMLVAAQLELRPLDLVLGRRAREAVGEFEESRHLERCHALDAEARELLFAGLRVERDDPCFHILFAHRRRHADDDALADPRMLADDRFDLVRGDILAAPADPVRLAPHEEQVAV